MDDLCDHGLLDARSVLVRVDELLSETGQDLGGIELAGCYGHEHPPECGPVDHVNFFRRIGLDGVPLLDSDMWILERFRLVALPLPLGKFSGLNVTCPFVLVSVGI